MTAAGKKYLAVLITIDLAKRLDKFTKDTRWKKNYCVEMALKEWLDKQ